MGPGTILDERFVLEAVVGQGGMGRVHRAIDKRSGLPVAVKLMVQADPRSVDAARFASEVAVLSELSHPGIVSYVAHGTTPDGTPYLAMELLEGEDLDARLARGPLSISDTLDLGERVASALHEAHRQGIVHRDLKPTNLFLRGGAIDRVSVLDFGIARRANRERGLTGTGSVIGTPEYMAPEQVQGSPDVGPAADVFALGCVLYECLSGAPAFSADHLLATLSKVVLEDPIPLDRIRPDVSEALGALIARMLAKSPSDRFANGAEVANALRELPKARAGSRPSSMPAPAGLGGRELELVSVIIATVPRTGANDATLDAATPRDAARAEALRRELSARGGSIEVEPLADGSLVATLGQHGGSAVDQALEATACARIVQLRWPEATIAVATARRVAGARVPVGEALERAVRLLPRSPLASSAKIFLDDVTAALVEGRARTEQAGGGRMTLHEEPALADDSRLLLGKPTPCVGREQEIATLESTLAASFDEGTARAVLVTAPPGLGKSRLRHELLRRIERRGEGESGPTIFEARGELMRAASPHGLVAQMIRRAFGVTSECDIDAARRKMLEGAARFVDADEARDVAELLGEICSTPFPDDDSVRLRGARQDPRLMQARIGDAFVALLRGATMRSGTLLVLEDLHWGDKSSIDLVGLALRELEERPLFVVAFARPELGERYPSLWKGRVTELPLRPLGRRACERLVARVAQDRLDGGAIARIVEQSAGNALFLEELIRAACDGHAEALPETVLAMLQARIGALAPSERRLLRAAAVFGETFDLDAVGAVLGRNVRPDEIDSWIAELEREEVVERVRDGSASSRAYRFRHALMRDAAESLLTDDDRRLAHALAAGWLAGRETDPGIVAEHYWLAGDRPKALPWFAKAAELASDRDEFAEVARLGRRARECGASGEALGAIEALDAMGSIMAWKWDEALAAATTAISLVTPGSKYSARALRVQANVFAYRNDLDGLARCVDAALGVEPASDARMVFGDALLHMASSATQVGLVELGVSLLAKAEAALAGELPRYPAVHAWLDVIRCTVLRHTSDDLPAQMRLLTDGIALYTEAGASAAMNVLARDVLGEVLARAGDLDGSEQTLRKSYADAAALGAGFIVSHATLSLATGLLARRDDALRDEASLLAKRLLDTPGISAGYVAMARDVLAHAHLLRGEAADAEREARVAIELSPHTPVRRWGMVARLADALVMLGREGEACEVTRRALSEMDATLGGGYSGFALLFAACRAHRASELLDEASALELRARTAIDRDAELFEDEGARARFVAHKNRELASAT